MRILWLFTYSIVCALLLTFFSNIHDFTKYIFSLGALYLGMRFFRRFEGIGFRIWFIAIAVVLYFIFSLIYALYTQMGITAP
ncbi:hypothetical protein ACFPES_24325 [Paenibacillus sp. GCM10023248]|uniref:hypothetical protein n=1 Tax=Bacillales TaxID=1385 RepID=UPI0023790005|nr:MULTISPECIES: hypothetical protein [Bacillales]MDD9270188.1 hypothetical protein [Paenibacillus sp. MAHUQ-63]MDR6880323.1 hypothetical protein [Bacillus sp. 3255]